MLSDVTYYWFHQLLKCMVGHVAQVYELLVVVIKVSVSSVIIVLPLISMDICTKSSMYSRLKAEALSAQGDIR